MPFGKPDDDFENLRNRNELSCENHERPHPQQNGDKSANGPVVSMVEKIAHCPPAVFRRQAPDFRPDRVCQDERSDACRADPPPGTPTEGVAKTGSSDSGPRPDVRREKCRRQKTGPEPAAGNKEVISLSNFTRDEETDCDEEGRIQDQGRELKIHLITQC